MAAGLTLVNVQFQIHASGSEIRHVTLIQRVLGAGAVVWFYLGKSVWPGNLLFVYPQWNIDPSNPLWWCPLIAAVALTVALWCFRHYGCSCVRCFSPGYISCIALLPVMGFVDVGYMATSLVADHYVHLAVIGVVALAAAALVYWQSKLSPSHKLAVPAVAGVVAVGFALLSFRYAELYGQPLELYQKSLCKIPIARFSKSSTALNCTKQIKQKQPSRIMKQR